ncbi:MAG TPA: hypothetical protein VGG74_21015 [Kofleriaceae bacterium]|jgi:CHAD domain-containing protein
MSRYVVVRLTFEQAEAAANACDLIRDSHEASGNRRDAAIYRRAYETLERALDTQREGTADVLRRLGAGDAG